MNTLTHDQLIRTDITDNAKEIRKALKRKYPECKFSVSIQRYSGGQSMSIHLISAPFDAFRKDLDNFSNQKDKNYFPGRGTDREHQQYLINEGTKQLNHFYLNDDKTLTDKAKDCMLFAYALTQKYNWDNSDSMTDYYDVNFALHLEVGKWDKPFENKGGDKQCR